MQHLAKDMDVLCDYDRNLVCVQHIFFLLNFPEISQNSFTCWIIKSIYSSLSNNDCRFAWLCFGSFMVNYPDTRAKGKTESM